MTKNVTESCEVSENKPDPVSVPVGQAEPVFKRQQVADALGVTVSEVRRLERTGAIRPIRRNAQGVWLFDATEVRAMADERKPVRGLTRKSNDSYTPEEAGAVFDALDAGKTLVQCVRECKLMPRTVETIALDYARLTGGMYVRKETMDIINGLSLEGTFPLKGDDDLLDVLKTAATDTCKECKTRSRTYCKVCTVKVAQRQMREL
jgi:hypothetical protein